VLSSLGLKVPAIVEEVKSSLAAGLCVVIGLQTTGEVCAAINTALNLVNFPELLQLMPRPFGTTLRQFGTT